VNMFEIEEEQRLDKILKITKIIWSAIFVSLPIYLIVCKLIEKQQILIVDPTFPINTFSAVLLVVSVATLFVTFFIRKKLLHVKHQSKSVTSTTGSSGDWIDQVKARYSIAVVLSAALSESVGIYGLVIFLLSLKMVMLYQFLLLSTVGLYIFRPRKKELMDFAAKIKRQQ